MDIDKLSKEIVAVLSLSSSELNQFLPSPRDDLVKLQERTRQRAMELSATAEDRRFSKECLRIAREETLHMMLQKAVDKDRQWNPVSPS